MLGLVYTCVHGRVGWKGSSLLFWFSKFEEKTSYEDDLIKTSSVDFGLSFRKVVV